MDRQPGVPSLLRLVNDRRALEIMMSRGPLTRSELGRRTGVSRVTASQSLARLEARGLVEVVGTRSAGRGPNAEVYGVPPRVGRAVGLDVRDVSVGAAVATITGQIEASIRRDCEGGDPIDVCLEVIDEIVTTLDLDSQPVLSTVAAAPGLIDPATRDVVFSYDLPQAPGRLRDALVKRLASSVEIDNDVNLAALAEERLGVASGESDYVLLWLGRGIGLGVVLGGRLHRGATGAAGEIGYLPVPGVPLPERVDYVSQGSYQRLVGTAALATLAREHGLDCDPQAVPAAVAELVATATVSADEQFLPEVATRVALGVAAVCTVLDPSLVVLTGETGRAGGEALAGLVRDRVGAVAPVHPRVVASVMGPDAVLQGAVLRAVDTARATLLARVEDEPGG